MIKTITYVDYGYMSNSFTMLDKDRKPITDQDYIDAHPLVREAYFRIGWLEERTLMLSFYKPEDIQKILNDTESLSLMNLLNRSVEVEHTESGPRIKKFLK